MPQGIVLNLKKGSISNGEIVGNNNVLICSKGGLNHVKISGVWNVPLIKSSYFKDLSYENSLKDVLALTNPNVNNKVIIEAGDYFVSAKKNLSSCLLVGSNTELIIDGTIKLVPNNYEGCDIIKLEGDNIIVHGRGTIIGDKYTHTGNQGEWGMGIKVYEGKNIKIYDLTIQECWGDCIYIGGRSKNIEVNNCDLSHGRRQGISITSAQKVTIRNCRISHVSGTEPEFAIDVEPNKNCLVDNVLVEDVVVDDCVGGFEVYGLAKNAKIGSVSFRNCNLNNIHKIPMAFEKCNKILIRNIVCSGDYTINSLFIKDVDKHTIENVYRLQDNIKTKVVIE